jgi:hypothetical protein
MIDYLQQAWDFHTWSVIAVLAALVTMISVFADRRRHRRKIIEAVGFMPWTGISVMATLVTVISLALALKQG